MNKRNQNKGEKVADKSYNYNAADYTSKDETTQGLAITHEQVSDTWAEGSIDGQIDSVNENGELRSHDGEDLSRKGYKE
ncbi:YozQ family protein [Pseudalkalibacillus caeni]|uniref:DUF4025 domain-containing protein n=1 Tax=Exobacillus caeni TaxID=2574798 RepID=A0A5R9FDX4_9BACL|nr:YozQ family protein [Pseudalkalibacillus caeni]TLS38764.1 DUF4025 domain-containing protein [Pseudalkalibacillus caeni]